MFRNFTMLLCIFSFVFLSCRNTNPDRTVEPKQELKIVYSNWSEGIAASYLAKTILETNFNFKITPVLTEIDTAYHQLATGEADILMDAWLPQTHNSYYNSIAGNVIDVGILFDNARTGFLVPAEAPIETIAELQRYTDTLFGIGTSGVSQYAKEALNAYELNLFFLQEDEARMLAHYDSLSKRQKPVVITGWRPHPIFLRYELKFLQDPERIFPTSDDIHILFSRKAAKQHPDLLKLFGRMQLNETQFQELIRQVTTHPEGETAGAKTWIKENALLVEGWLKNLHQFKAKPM